MIVKKLCSFTLAISVLRFPQKHYYIYLICYCVKSTPAQKLQDQFCSNLPKNFILGQNRSTTFILKTNKFLVQIQPAKFFF